MIYIALYEHLQPTLHEKQTKEVRHTQKYGIKKVLLENQKHLLTNLI